MGARGLFRLLAIEMLIGFGGVGVEALFKSISSVLVERKDKIERDRVLRHKNSVMLTDPTKDAAEAGKGTKGRYGCCA